MSLKTLQRGEILFQVTRQVSWKKILKKTKKKTKTRRTTVPHASRCMLPAPGCAKLHWRAPGCEPTCSVSAKAGEKQLFSTGLWKKKTQFFRPSPLGN